MVRARFLGDLGCEDLLSNYNMIAYRNDKRRRALSHYVGERFNLASGRHAAFGGGGKIR